MAITILEPGNSFRDAKGIRWNVGKDCGINDNSGHWYCITHDRPFANPLEMGSHFETGEHTAVWWCHLDGPETTTVKN